jgi:hypothetical protein
MSPDVNARTITVATVSPDALARDYCSLGVSVEDLGLLIPGFPTNEHQQPRG